LVINSSLVCFCLHCGNGIKMHVMENANVKCKLGRVT
jgi:hypothetical protein